LFEIFSPSHLNGWQNILLNASFTFMVSFLVSFKAHDSTTFEHVAFCRWICALLHGMDVNRLCVASHRNIGQNVSIQLQLYSGSMSTCSFFKWLFNSSSVLKLAPHAPQFQVRVIPLKDFKSSKIRKTSFLG